MIARVARLVLSNRTPHGRYVRHTLKRIRNRRALTFAKNRYNMYRQNYYTHVTRKMLPKDYGKVSIIVPCYNTKPRYFEALLDSVFAQGYDNWELVLADGSTDLEIAAYLEDRAKADTRIVYKKIKNKGIAINTNAGFNMASGEYIALLDHDDTLDPDALAESIELFAHDKKLGLVYSDEDKVSDDGEKYFEAHFKPDFSLDLLRNVNYITHFVLVRKDIVDTLGGIREGFDGAQDFDFLLRVADLPDIHIGHVAKILYHWRQAEGSTAANFASKSNVTANGVKALKGHFERRGLDRISPYAIVDRPGFYAARYGLTEGLYRINIQLQGTHLLEAERQFIADAYKENDDVKKYKITVCIDEAIKQTDLVVNGAFIPATTKTPLTPLFGLAKEPGVAGVAPKVVRNGRIYDMGIVIVNDQPKRLFYGINPERQMCFGSLEWVRNVDKLSHTVYIESSNQTGRVVTWAHSEFVAFSPQIPNDPAQVSGFYNPNIIELTEIVEDPSDYISDIVKVDA